MTERERVRLQATVDALKEEAAFSRERVAQLREAIVETDENLQIDIVRLKELHQLNVGKKESSAAYHEESANKNSARATEIEGQIDSGAARVVMEDGMVKNA